MGVSIVDTWHGLSIGLRVFKACAVGTIRSGAVVMVVFALSLASTTNIILVPVHVCTNNNNNSDDTCTRHLR